MKKTLLCILLSTAFLLCAAPISYAEETAAKELTGTLEFYSWDTADTSPLTDSNEGSCATIGYTGSLTITSQEPIASLYVEFYLESKPWILKANGNECDRGRDSFLHEHVDVASLTGESKEIVMTFPKGASISEIRAFTAGKLPDDLQVWDKPCKKADLLLFSSHSDDEQLFFAGVLPYSVDYGAAVQVVYFCEHTNTPVRPHEQLNGLWAAGIRNYPVIGIFPDLYSESREGGMQVFANAGYGYDDFLEWQVENLRRFKPQVVIGHDAAGEYGHGTHIINSETLRDAVSAAADAENFPYSAAQYGVWDTPKLYLHLWAENEIVMDFDQPLEHFGGKTAYEMSNAGYECHVSQHWTWFTEWMRGTANAPITKASQITKYSPCRYGLWRTTVGADTKADFFDNIELYSIQQAKQDALTETTEPQSTDAPDTQTSAQGSISQDNAPKKDSKITLVLAVAAVAIIVLCAVCAVVGKPKKNRMRSSVRTRAAESNERSHLEAEKLREARAAQMRRMQESEKADSVNRQSCPGNTQTRRPPAAEGGQGSTPSAKPQQRRTVPADSPRKESTSVKEAAPTARRSPQTQTARSVQGSADTRRSVQIVQNENRRTVQNGRRNTQGGDISKKKPISHTTPGDTVYDNRD